MTDKPKPLTREEWEKGPTPAIPTIEWLKRVNVLIDALFAYRERTRGMIILTLSNVVLTNDIAAELGLE